MVIVCKYVLLFYILLYFVFIIICNITGVFLLLIRNFGLFYINDFIVIVFFVLMVFFRLVSFCGLGFLKG